MYASFQVYGRKRNKRHGDRTWGIEATNVLNDMPSMWIHHSKNCTTQVTHCTKGWAPLFCAQSAQPSNLCPSLIIS